MSENLVTNKHRKCCRGNQGSRHNLKKEVSLPRMPRMRQKALSLRWVHHADLSLEDRHCPLHQHCGLLDQTSPGASGNSPSPKVPFCSQFEVVLEKSQTRGPFDVHCRGAETSYMSCQPSGAPMKHGVRCTNLDGRGSIPSARCALIQGLGTKNLRRLAITQIRRGCPLPEPLNNRSKA